MCAAALSQDQYINRELSWIAFNQRVLAQAIDQRTPLLDQAKFSAIFSNNLDEFFMVRVASLKSQVEAGISTPSEDGKTPFEQLQTIREHLLPLLKQQQEHYRYQLKQQLKITTFNCLITRNSINPNAPGLMTISKPRSFPFSPPWLSIPPIHFPSLATSA
jgi:polyphosphate kinase